MLSSPQYSMTTRSRPTPAPACGGAPSLNPSMYACRWDAEVAEGQEGQLEPAKARQSTGVHECKAPLIGTPNTPERCPPPNPQTQNCNARMRVCVRARARLYTLG
eukprot:356552-Chlamydomonas_euryale.AAC.9